VNDEKNDRSHVVDLPLETKSQEKAKEEKLHCVTKGRLKLYDPKANNVQKFIKLLSQRINRPLASSMVACAHCGMCADSCHYALAKPAPLTRLTKYAEYSRDTWIGPGELFPGGCMPVLRPVMKILTD
jgi:ferredoxin